jgi:hypothetical protein
VKSIFRVDRLRDNGSHQYVWGAVVAAALIAVVALAFGRLGAYVDFDGSSVGTKVEQDTRLVVSGPEQRAAAIVVREPDESGPVATLGRDPSPSAASPSSAPAGGSEPFGDAGSASEQPADGGSGAGEPPAQTGQTPQTGEPPVAVEPIAPPAANPEPAPVETRPVDEPAGPSPTPVSAPSGPIAATTAGLDNTLGTLGVDLPLTELTDPVTEPADHLLDLLSGQSG